MPESAEFAHRFGGVARLFGANALKRLSAAHVCVIGLGGVGSWTVEALARSGVGALTLVDFDEVCVTNVNRQLPALTENVGRPKTLVLAERVAGINPACRVEPVVEFFTRENSDRILTPRYDHVVDATDSLQHKLLAIWQCRERGLPVLTVGGSAGKRDGTCVCVADLSEATSDALLRFVRKRLRERHGFPRGEGARFNVRCVYSPERPVYPWSDGRICPSPEPGCAVAPDCASGLGSAAFVTGAFGLAAAGEVVRALVVPPETGAAPSA
jgi:tRNA A37 threonylcarbamoyladenosine dehydratase